MTEMRASIVISPHSVQQQYRTSLVSAYHRQKEAQQLTATRKVQECTDLIVRPVLSLKTLTFARLPHAARSSLLYFSVFIYSSVSSSRAPYDIAPIDPNLEV